MGRGFQCVHLTFSLSDLMTPLPAITIVVYKSKGGKGLKTFDALEWLAAMRSHVPNEGEQVVMRC